MPLGRAEKREILDAFRFLDGYQAPAPEPEPLPEVVAPPDTESRRRLAWIRELRLSMAEKTDLARYASAFAKYGWPEHELRAYIQRQLFLSVTMSIGSLRTQQERGEPDTGHEKAILQTLRWLAAMEAQTIYRAGIDRAPASWFTIIKNGLLPGLSLREEFEHVQKTEHKGGWREQKQEQKIEAQESIDGPVSVSGEAYSDEYTPVRHEQWADGHMPEPEDALLNILLWQVEPDPRNRAIYDLDRQGYKYEEIISILGLTVTPERISQIKTGIERKMGMVKQRKKPD